MMTVQSRRGASPRFALGTLFQVGALTAMGLLAAPGVRPMGAVLSAQENTGTVSQPLVGGQIVPPDTQERAGSTFTEGGIPVRRYAITVI